MASGLRSLLSLLAVFLTVWLGIKLLLPLFSPFLFGLLLALAAEPMVSFLHKRLRLPRSLGAGLGVASAFCFLGAMVLLLCAFLVRELKALAAAAPELEAAAGAGLTHLRTWLLDLTLRAPKGLRPVLQESVSSLLSDGAALVDSILRFLLSFGGNLLSHIPDSALGLATAVLSGFMISAKLPKLRRWLRRPQCRERLRPLFTALRGMKTAFLGWGLAQLKLMAVTYGLLLLGLMFLRVPSAPLWALAITLVDAFPILGTGTVLLPWALIGFLRQETARALGLLGLYALISLSRSLLEPKLLGSHLGLDPLVTLMALYAGYQLWGVGGMILGPLLVVCAIRPLSKPEKT